MLEFNKLMLTLLHIAVAAATRTSCGVVLAPSGTAAAKSHVPKR